MKDYFLALLLVAGVAAFMYWYASNGLMFVGL